MERVLRSFWRCRAAAGRGRVLALATLATMSLSWTQPQPARAQAAAADAAATLPFSLRMIGPGVYAAIDGPAGRSGSNAGFVIGDDGVLVIDSFYDPEAAKALLAQIRLLTPKPVRYVVNTHYHVDHVGGDAVFREAGAVIIAHRNVRGWVRTENGHLFGDHPTAAQRDQIAALALPDLVTDGALTVWLGDRRVDIRTVRGHTGGDLVVSVPGARILFCGDLLWRRVSPNIIDGTVSRWIATLADFQAGSGAAATTFVPGHGDVATLADVAALQAYLGDLTDFTAQARAAGLTADSLTATVLPRMKAKYGDWTAFGYFAPKEIGYMEAELAGTKRVPTPAAD
jgi:glyoxylase-like metal-dependent hydrolase (beta-lactamase superfamily II)